MIPIATVLIRAADGRHVDHLALAVFEQQIRDLEVLVAFSEGQESSAIIPDGLPIVALPVPPGTPAGEVVNRAASIASGHYLVTVHPEARIKNDRWLSNLLAPFLDGRTAAVSGADYDSDRVSLQASSYCLELFDFLLAPRHGPSISNAAFRLDLVRQYPFDRFLPSCADKEWALRLLLGGYQIVMGHEFAVELPEEPSLEDEFRRFWKTEQALASIFCEVDAPRLLWERALATRRPDRLFKAWVLGRMLTRHRKFWRQELGDSMKARAAFMDDRRKRPGAKGERVTCLAPDRKKVLFALRI